MRGLLESWSAKGKGKDDTPGQDVVWVIQPMSHLSYKLSFCCCCFLSLTGNNWKMGGEQLSNGDGKTACGRREEGPKAWPVWENIEG